MPTYNEKTAFVVRNQSTGAPLTTATVQLRRGASTIAMSHIGQGFYTANSVPRGRWEVWIDGVNSGMTHGVGVGKLEDVGHEVGLYPQSQADGWSLVPLDLSAYRLLSNGSFGVGITAPSLVLSGALTGTSASFSQALTINGTSLSIPLVLNNSLEACQIRFDSSTTTTGWRVGIASDATGDFIWVNDDDSSSVPIRVLKADSSVSLLRDLRLQSNLLINNPADTFAYTIVGGAITANRQLNLPVISATDTISVLGLAQTFGAVQTARGWALTSQSNSPTTAYTWTLTSGNQANINLASSTGNVTITTASPTTGVHSILRVVGHATLARQVTLTQTGVTFVKAGVASGASIVLDTIAALEEACYRLHWITTTLCFVDRVNSLSGGMTLSGHQNVVTPWSLGSGANFNAVSAGFQVDPVGTYGLHFKGNTLIEQASGQALRLYRATSGTTSEVCLPFALQDSLGNVEDYGEICARIDSSTSGAEKGTLTFDYKQNGSLVLGATLNENGFTASQILNSVTISSIYSGLRLNGVTSGTISNYLSHNGIQSIVPFFGGTATLGIDSSAGVTVPVDTTFLAVTSTTKMAFPRFFRTAQSSAIGSAIIEIEVSANLSSSPFTYSFRNRTAFTLGAGGTFNSGIPLVVPVIP